MICCPCGGEATVGMYLTDVTTKFVGNRYDRMSTIQLELIFISISGNGICKKETIKHLRYI